MHCTAMFNKTNIILNKKHNTMLYRKFISFQASLFSIF